MLVLIFILLTVTIYEIQMKESVGFSKGQGSKKIESVSLFAAKDRATNFNTPAWF